VRHCSRLCDEDEELSEVTDSDVVPEQVKDWLTSLKDWLTSTFTCQGLAHVTQGLAHVTQGLADVHVHE